MGTPQASHNPGLWPAAVGEIALRREICDIGRRVYDRGLVVATDGNISCKLADGSILVTPSGSCLGELTPQDIVHIGLGGQTNGRPTSELGLHTTIYEVRSDIRAILHAHPPAAIAFSLARADLARDLLPEVVLAMGRIGPAPYATPTTEEVGRSVREIIKDHDSVILERHGSVTVGPDLKTAFFHLERVEHAARVIYMATQLGEIDPLSGPAMERLHQVRDQYVVPVDDTMKPDSNGPSPFPRR